MTKQNDITPATVFHNIQVTAIPKIDPGTGKVKYDTSFDPDVAVITTTDAVINYQLVPQTPAGVQFKDVKIKQKTPQLSTPSISLSGKLVTLSDANTAKESINLTFHFVDKDGVEFSVDPIVENEPDPPM